MKTKTAVVILNCNLPDYTDMLYESLKPYERNDYDVFVFDNGSTPEGMSKYTLYRAETNAFFGGGFEAAREIVLANPAYDSLLFMNNDITVHGANFVRSLREAMFAYVGGDYGPDDPDDNGRHVVEHHVVSPCFFNIEPQGQCHWKTMWNWCSTKPRVVPFVDLQSPLIHRELLEKLDGAGRENPTGWGIDAYIAITCRRNDWTMAVLDNVSMLHHNSLTVKRGVAGINVQEYCRRAEFDQFRFFQSKNLLQQFHEVRQLGEQYNG